MDQEIKNLICLVIPEYRCGLEYFEENEQTYGIDAACFSKGQIIEVLKKLNTSSIHTIMSYVAAMRKYASMLKKRHGQKGISWYDHFEANDYESCVNRELTKKNVFTRNDILKICNRLDEEFQYLLLGMHEGIGARRLMDLVELKFADVSHNLVHLPSGIDVVISNDLYKIIKECYRKYGKNGYVYPCERKRGGKDPDDAIITYRYRRLRLYANNESLIPTNIKRSGLAERIIALNKRQPIMSATEMQNLEGIEDLFYIYGYDTAKRAIKTMHKILMPYFTA